jgi:hypothetical protein
MQPMALLRAFRQIRERHIRFGLKIAQNAPIKIIKHDFFVFSVIMNDNFIN